MTARRCVVCLQPPYAHTPSRLMALGLWPHPYDPGERRSGTDRRQAGEERRAA